VVFLLNIQSLSNSAQPPTSQDVVTSVVYVLIHESEMSRVMTMAVLSDMEIEECIREGSLVIAPFDDCCLAGAGYDLRLSEDMEILAGQNRLVATLERVELGERLVGTLYLRSTLARASVMGSLALVDPGFRGQLTVSLFNAGQRVFRMKGRDRFLQIVFHRLGVKTARPYAGKYQDSQGVVDSRP